MIIPQERSKLLSMAAKIQQLLMIMQILPNISNNPVHTNRPLHVHSSINDIDSTIAARSYILVILFVTTSSLSQKRMDACNNSKDGG
jgi:hypothetical protein